MTNLQNTLAATATSSTAFIPPSYPQRVGVCRTAPSSTITNQLAAPASHTITPSCSDQQGELLPIVFKPNPRPLRTTAAPLGHNIPHSIKLKIWQHKYVELADLINNAHRSTDYTLDLTTEDGQPQFRLSTRKKKPLTQNEWSQAFDIFIAIYIERYPQETPQILAYTQTIKDLMNNRANWVWYDTQFRTDREYTHCPWDEIRQDLELRAFRTSLSSSHEDKPFRKHEYSQKKSNQSHNDDHVPTGYCFAYHSRNQRCTTSNCTFKHACPRCKGPHPAFMRCNKPETRRPSSPANRRPPQPPNNNHKRANTSESRKTQ